MEILDWIYLAQNSDHDDQSFVPIHGREFD
jgi:hypothetical protein